MPEDQTVYLSQLGFKKGLGSNGWVFKVQIGEHGGADEPHRLANFVRPLDFAMVSVLSTVLPKQVMWLWVWLPNLDTAHNRVPLPRYWGYKQVFQPTIFSQQNQIHTYNYKKYFLQILYSSYLFGNDPCNHCVTV